MTCRDCKGFGFIVDVVRHVPDWPIEVCDYCKCEAGARLRAADVCADIAAFRAEAKAKKWADDHITRNKGY